MADANGHQTVHMASTAQNSDLNFAEGTVLYFNIHV